MLKRAVSIVPLLALAICFAAASLAAGPPIVREILEPVTRAPVQGAFLDYSPTPVGAQLPMPQVLWKRMPRNEAIREGGLLHVMKASRIQVTEFAVVANIDERDYVYLQIQFADGVFREIPLFVDSETVKKHVEDQLGEHLDRARFRMDGRSEKSARRVVGTYYFGLIEELQERGTENSFALDPESPEVAAMIKEAERHPAPHLPEDDSGRVYLELRGRRLGEFLGLQESGNADSILLVEEVIRHSETDLCPDSGAGPGKRENSCYPLKSGLQSCSFGSPVP